MRSRATALRQKERRRVSPASPPLAEARVLADRQARAVRRRRQFGVAACWNIPEQAQGLRLRNLGDELVGGGPEVLAVAPDPSDALGKLR
jgi:hypothetical protein